MITANPEQARAFFAAKLAFTTGPVELNGMLNRDEDVIIIDVRRADDYAKSHIPGAINLPQGQWRKAKGLSQDKLHVVYCYSQTCHLAAGAALEFASQGYRVMEMEGGFAAWTAGKHAVEGSECACDTAA